MRKGEGGALGKTRPDGGGHQEHVSQSFGEVDGGKHHNNVLYRKRVVDTDGRDRRWVKQR